MKRSDDAISRLLDTWGLGSDQALAPCPRCGRLPQLMSVSVGVGLVEHWYECRKWFGLRLCLRGPWLTEEHGWDDYGERGARSLWNRAFAQKDP